MASPGEPVAPWKHALNYLLVVLAVAGIGAASLSAAGSWGSTARASPTGSS